MGARQGDAIDTVTLELRAVSEGSRPLALTQAASASVHDVWAFRAAVVALGVALSVFLIGAAVVFAIAKTVPDQYWTAGSAISGALIGILVPTKPDPQGTTGVAPAPTGGTIATTPPEPQWKKKYATVQLLNENLRPMILFTIFVVSLILSAVLGSSQELHSLAAASAGALIGVLVPAPSRH